jgi:hypothetical protein
MPREEFYEENHPVPEQMGTGSNTNGFELSIKSPKEEKTVKRRSEGSDRKRGNKDTEPKLCGSCLLKNILDGDRGIIQGYFFTMLGKFRNIRAYYGSRIDVFVDDLCSVVGLAIREKDVNGTLDKIRHPKSYVFKIIEYQSIKEDKRLGRLVSLDLLYDEEGGYDF